MTDLREAAQQALEALETLMLERGSIYDTAITALREALEQPEQEPVAWLSRDEAGLALWDAIHKREFGNPTDDKLILNALRDKGLWIGRLNASLERAALAQPEQEPTPWREMVVVSLVRKGIDKHKARELADHFAAQRPWQGLTDDDWAKIGDMPDTFDQGVAWAQARLKERNT